MEVRENYATKLDNPLKSTGLARSHSPACLAHDGVVDGQHLDWKLWVPLA